MLCTPLHFPPEWDKVVRRHFLLGVPFIGPQVAVYRALSDQLRKRTDECWTIWGCDLERLRVARLITKALVDAGDWPNAFFVPDDPFILAAWDHSACAIDHLRMVSALIAIEQKLELENKSVDWDAFESATLGEVVDELRRLAESEASPTSSSADAKGSAVDQISR